MQPRKNEYTLKEAAEVLGRHWKTVRNWVVEGKVKAIKMGRIWLIKAAEIRRIRRYGVDIENKTEETNND